MASEAPAFDPLGLISCSRPASLASTTGLSSNHLASDDDDEKDAGEHASDSNHDDISAEPMLPEPTSDLWHAVVQKLEGTWAGQGASYGELYVIESHGDAVCCLRKGLSAPKKWTVSWYASKKEVILGGRYTLDPADLLADVEQIVWRRVAVAGKHCKEVTWKRFQRAQKKTLAPKSETRETFLSCKDDEKAAHEVHHGSQCVYSRSIMLSVHCRPLQSRSENNFISLKSVADIQCVSPDMAPTCRSATEISKKALKATQELTSMPSAAPSFQGDSELCAHLAASSTETVSGAVKPNLDLALHGLESQQSRTRRLAAVVAKPLQSTVGAPSKALRQDAPEFVPCLAQTAANELRAETPESVACSMLRDSGSTITTTSDVRLESDTNEYSSKDSSVEASSASD